MEKSRSRSALHPRDRVARNEIRGQHNGFRLSGFVLQPADHRLHTAARETGNAPRSDETTNGRCGNPFGRSFRRRDANLFQHPGLSNRLDLPLGCECHFRHRSRRHIKRRHRDLHDQVVAAGASGSVSGTDDSGAPADLASIFTSCTGQLQRLVRCHGPRSRNPQLHRQHTQLVHRFGIHQRAGRHPAGDRVDDFQPTLDRRHPLRRGFP